MKRLRCCSLIFFIIIIAFSWSDTFAQTNDKAKNILVIQSYHEQYKWSNDILTAIKFGFQKSGFTPRITVEYMQAKQFNDETYFKLLFNMYEYKYSKSNYDLIFVADEYAYDFIIKYGKNIFNNTPIVFCGVEKYDKDEIKEYGNITGVIERPKIKENLEMIFNLQPDIEKIILISDEHDVSEFYVNTINEFQEKYKDQIEIVSISGSNVYEIKERIDIIGGKSAIFIGPWYIANDGSFTTELKAVEWLSDNIEFPIYSAWGTYAGHGLVGGEMLYGYFHAKDAVNSAIEILKGKKVEEISIVENNNFITRFEYNMLKRFNISEDKLPVGSKINGVPKSTYKVPKKVIWSIGFCIAVIVIFIVKILRDNIIKRKSAEMKERKNKELICRMKEQEKGRDDFFANISHELKTPINVILSTLQYIELRNRNEEMTEKNKKLNSYYSSMRINCYRLLKLVNNLIDMTKLEAGYFKLEIMNYEIVSVVEDITLSVANYINSKGVELIFDTEVEEKIIACDAEKIERIVLNLLSNAVKFTDSGGKIFVNIFDKKEWIEISIRDTGVGIPREKKDSIFNRFVQVDKSISKNKEGSGIGLSLVKSLVDKHGGKISVESEWEKGAEFIVALPVRVIEDEEVVLNQGFMKEAELKKVTIEFSDVE